MTDNHTCPVCFSHKTEKYIKASNQHGKTVLEKKENFEYYQCSECNSVFLTGTPINKSYYQTYYSFPESNKKSNLITSIEKWLDVRTNNKKREVIEELVTSKKRKIDLLDIGCGAGNFLASLDKKKYNGIGIEKDKKEFLICKQKNLEVYCADIYRHNFADKKFDVITLWHVIEHIPDPHKLLKKIKTLLKKDGILIMTTPNSDSLGFRYSQEQWFHLDAPRHLILYSEKGMKDLSAQNGFSIKKILSQTFEFPLDLFWSLRQSNMKYLLYIIYPLAKKISKETITYVLMKSDEK